MRRFIKAMLLWMLIAVVPLNATAAAARMFCGTAHQQAAGDHEHHGTVDERPAPAAHDDASGNAPATCGAASAACIGAAAPPPPAVAVTPLTGLGVFALTAVPKVARFIPDGLKRPPRELVC